MRPDQAEAIDKRIKKRVDITDEGCWQWLGARARSNGYARMTVGSRADDSRRTDLAHRISYETFVGPIPDGLHIDHLCRNRACVNPAHLEAVTCRENLERGIGTLGRYQQTQRTPKGH